jgi:hypothetical protein
MDRLRSAGTRGRGAYGGRGPWRAKSIAFVLGLADLVPDDAANRGAADGSDRAAAREYRAADGADARTDGGVLILLRHAGTRAQSDKHCGSQGVNRKTLNRLHGDDLFVERGESGAW